MNTFISFVSGGFNKELTQQHAWASLSLSESSRLLAKIKVFGVLPAQWPLFLDAGTVLVTIPPLIRAGFVYWHCTGSRTIHAVKIAVHSVKGCCTVTTMALTSINNRCLSLQTCNWMEMWHNVITCSPPMNIYMIIEAMSTNPILHKRSVTFNKYIKQGLISKMYTAHWCRT